MDRFLRFWFQVIGECHSIQISDKLAARYRMLRDSKDCEIFLEFCLHAILYQPSPQSGGCRAGLSIVQYASVAAIASSYSNMELLDLSGSSISDSGIGMICNVFPETLLKLLLALCPNITSSGIQFTAAQLPRLELMDFGMTICDPNLEISNEEGNDSDLRRTSNSKLQLIYQKLIIKHSRLKKLSLWGCSGLDALYLNCPQLVDLNINSCRNLHSERLLLQCPNFESVHASGCQDMMVKTIQNQVCYDFSAVENHFPYKRVPDGSKRVRVPYLFSLQPCDEEKKCSRARKRLCAVIST
ncbi:F-box/LRR-repeat protein 17 [Abeliophyllum distichum]|uniref:F-box/LRR-repeat protein 17 n=1 Tax=Abeliophyllum distichum TaxID=126358 RepID=A0ABD1NSI5_9LAMI